MVSSPIDVSSGSLVVDGSLTLSAGANVTVGSTQALNVTGAVVLGGALVIELDTLPSAGGSVVIPVVAGSAVSGAFHSIDARADAAAAGSLRSCERLVTMPTSTTTSMSVVVTVDASGCRSIADNPGALAGIIIGCLALVALAVFVPLQVHRVNRKKSLERQLSKLQQDGDVELS